MLSFRGRLIKRALKASVTLWKKRTPRNIKLYRTKLDQMAKRIPVTRDVEMQSVSINGKNAEWLIPSSNAEQKQSTILYLHGGAYITGSVFTHRALCATITKKTDRRLLFLEYRLAPEHPFPAALEDAVDAYQWLLNQGIPSKQIALAGDSAGGGLCISTALMLRDRQIPLPASIACISPWVDLLHSGASHQNNARLDPLLITDDAKEAALQYTDPSNLRNPYVSPIYADLQGLPPVLIQVGSDEILLDDAVTLAKKIEQAKGDVQLRIWQGMWHVWHITGGVLPEAGKAVLEIRDFLDQHWGKQNK
ncbi:alpha/beta hydrolase [Risungbinella massiliensis]|uniref:alpha/beta hydrolase n=1 Tax=Risungbinella massiliensis TaxID=1329796 RepID=UPI0005CB9AFB|nr:alpha/beta hydrolase [Risungbinella massiliensis]